MIRIKICGITRLEDARCAADAGADFLGFIFYPPSPRYLPPKRAATIAAAIRDEFGAGGPRFVGVVVNEGIAAIRTLIEDVNLDLVQLHGDEPPEVLEALGQHAFKALQPRSLEDAQAALELHLRRSGQKPKAMPDLLVDAYHPRKRGGTGQPAEIASAQWLARRCRLMLAGGLTPENVAEAIRRMRPWGVDVSSGVELEKGVKDHARIQAFVDAVRSIEIAHHNDHRYGVDDDI